LKTKKFRKESRLFYFSIFV